MPTPSDEDAELLLQTLDDIDGLVTVASGRGEDQLLISKYLNSDVELREMLSAQDKELREVQEHFIEHHCAQAENLCTLYNEVAECENKLLSFEEKIFAFQRTLTDTAEDIVKMQQQTVELVHRVANRKRVSNKINEVYNALKECEEFCEEISSRDVDKEYLINIRELESKIAFLANNKELENSSVDQEIRPKLKQAALRAGDKLHRYLSKKIVALAEDSTNIVLQQQALEVVGQYAYSFLDRYNRPVADDLRAAYTRTMSEVYHRLMRHATRDFVEMLPYVSAKSDAILSAEVVRALRSGSDSGVVGGRFFLPPPQLASSHASVRRTTSVSIEDRMRDIADRVRGKSEGRAAPPSRAADIQDIVDSITATDLTYSVVNINPVPAVQLNQSTCWVWRFLKLFVAVINMVTGESSFVSKFFYAHGQNLESEETLTRHILQKALDTVQHTLVTELPSLSDRLSCLAAARVVDQMKSFLCQSNNPIPLLILSTIVETALNAFRKSLHRIVDDDQATLSSVAQIALAPHGPTHDPAMTTLSAAMVQNPKLRSALGPHDVTRQFALTSGCVHLLNTMPLAFSRVDGSAVVAFDEHVNQALRTAVTLWTSIVDQLARRYQETAAASIFRIQNYSYLLLVWRSLHQSYCPSGLSTDGGATAATATSGKDGLLLKGPYAAPQHQTETITFLLKNEVLRYVAEDAKHFGVSGIVALVQEAEQVLGAEFFAKHRTGSVTEAPTVALGELPLPLREQQVLATLSSFSKSWKEQLLTIAESVRGSFRLSNDVERARSITRDAATIEATACGDFGQIVSSLVLREYFQSVLDANAHVHTFVNAYYGNHSGIQAKLIGNHALVHEVQALVA